MSFIEYHDSQLTKLSAEQLEEARHCAVARSDRSLTFDLDSECYRKLFEPDRPSRMSATTVAPAPSLSAGPGDLVKIILDKLGIKPTRNCGCEAMRRRMNEWGYRGCWRHRREIAEWLSAKASEAGIEISAASIARLVADAVWERIVGASGGDKQEGARG